MTSFSCGLLPVMNAASSSLYAHIPIGTRTHQETVRDVSFSECGTTLCVRYDRHRFENFAVPSLEEKGTETKHYGRDKRDRLALTAWTRWIRAHLPHAHIARVSPCGLYALKVAPFSSGIQIWHVKTCEYLFTLDRHMTAVEHVAFSPDGRMLVSVDGHAKAFAWNMLHVERRIARLLVEKSLAVCERNYERSVHRTETYLRIMSYLCATMNFLHKDVLLVLSALRFQEDNRCMQWILDASTLWYRSGVVGRETLHTMLDRPRLLIDVLARLVADFIPPLSSLLATV